MYFIFKIICLKVVETNVLLLSLNMTLIVLIRQVYRKYVCIYIFPIKITKLRGSLSPFVKTIFNKLSYTSDSSIWSRVNYSNNHRLKGREAPLMISSWMLMQFLIKNRWKWNTTKINLRTMQIGNSNYHVPTYYVLNTIFSKTKINSYAST